MADDQAVAPHTAPPAVPVGVAITPLDFVIHVPDLRNGQLANIQQAAPKASIDAKWKWATIDNLPYGEAVNAVEYVIRGTYAVLLSHAAGQPDDAMRAEARRSAIVLGAIRAGAQAAYQLTGKDMTATELTPSGYRYVDGRIASKNDGGTAGGRYPLATSMAGLNPHEVALVSALVYLGMAVPALQGVSLVSTGHHFLPTTRNVFEGQKRQAFGLMTEQARAIVEQMGEAFYDLAFHKSCHPISPPVKRRLAKSTELAQRLQVSGHGAAAIRLPAVPSDAAVGKAGVALIHAALPVIKAMGHTASATHGMQLVAALERANEGVEERNAVADIQQWATIHAANLAFCAGIVQHVHESVGTGRNTLLSAFSVKKLMSDNATSVQLGVSYSRASAAKIRNALESGAFADPNITA